LALLEVMVHLEIDFEDLPTTFQPLGIERPVHPRLAPALRCRR
jgi:hypothetical protein